MRVNLKVPFSEKNTAKALGAQWDAAEKLWYVKNVPKLEKFYRWIPKSALSKRSSSHAKSKPAPKLVSHTLSAPSTPNALSIAQCGCATLPWLDCIHTAPNSSATTD